MKHQLWTCDWRFLIQLQPLGAFENLGESVLEGSGLDINLGSCGKAFVANDTADLEHDRVIVRLLDGS